MQEKSKIWYKIMHIFAKIGSIVYQMCHFLHTFGKVLHVFLQQSSIKHHTSYINLSLYIFPSYINRQPLHGPSTEFLILNF